MTYRKLLQADFVIVSDSFLTNASYKRKMHPFTHRFVDRSEGYDIYRTEMGFRRLTSPELEDETCPLLHGIVWNRLILDEIHLHILKREQSAFLHKLQANYVWLMTGTPLQKDGLSASQELTAYARLLYRFDGCRIEYPVPHDSANEAANEFRKLCASQNTTVSSMTSGFVRDIAKRTTFDDFCTRVVALHTPESLAHEVTFPPVSRHHYFIDLLPTERILYDYIAANHPSFAQLAEATVHPNLNLASGINLRVCESLEQVHAAMTEGLRKEKADLENQERSQKAVVEHYRSQLVSLGYDAFLEGAGVSSSSNSSISEGVDTEMEDALVESILDSEEEEEREMGVAVARIARHDLRLQKRYLAEMKHLKLLETNLAKLQRSLRFFENAAQLGPEERCVICLEAMNSGGGQIGFSICGHHACYGCMVNWVRSSMSCPVCRGNLTENDILVIAAQKAGAVTANETTGVSSFDNDRSLYGSKMAHLFNFLEERKNEKILVFSQFDSVLNRTIKLFREKGIPYATCFGNIGSREKGLRDFQTSSDVNVILLSTTNSSVGTNLVQANTVVFLDPVYQVSERDRLETQCLARVMRLTQKNPVKLVKFVVKNTIEEEVYLRDANVAGGN